LAISHIQEEPVIELEWLGSKNRRRRRRGATVVPKKKTAAESSGKISRAAKGGRMFIGGKSADQNVLYILNALRRITHQGDGTNSYAIFTCDREKHYYVQVLGQRGRRIVWTESVSNKFLKPAHALDSDQWLSFKPWDGILRKQGVAPTITAGGMVPLPLICK